MNLTMKARLSAKLPLFSLLYSQVHHFVKHDFIIQLFLNAYCPRFMEYSQHVPRSSQYHHFDYRKDCGDKVGGNLPEFTRSTSQVQVTIQLFYFSFFFFLCPLVVILFYIMMCWW